MSEPMQVSYYNSGKYKVIDVIDALNLNFSLGCVLKYLLRAGKKPGEESVKDLTKALDYLRHQIGLSSDCKVLTYDLKNPLCHEETICESFSVEGNLRKALHELLLSHLPESLNWIQQEVDRLNGDKTYHQMTLEEYIQIKEHPIKNA